jgi:hypothetical protein
MDQFWVMDLLWTHYIHTTRTWEEAIAFFPIIYYGCLCEDHIEMIFFLGILKFMGPENLWVHYLLICTLIKSLPTTKLYSSMIFFQHHVAYFRYRSFAFVSWVLMVRNQMSIWFLILNLVTTFRSHFKWKMQAHFSYLNIKSFPTYNFKKIEHDYRMHFNTKSLKLHNIPNCQSGSSSQELWECFLFIPLMCLKVFFCFSLLFDPFPFCFALSLVTCPKLKL